MRRFGFRMMLAGLIVALFAGTGRAQAAGDEPASLKARAAARFPQPVTVAALDHRLVIEPSNHQGALGHVAGVVRASDGDVKILLRYGGFLGLGTRVIAVPVEATGLLGQFLEVLDLDEQQLSALPTWKAGEGVPLADSDSIRIGLTKN